MLENNKYITKLQNTVDNYLIVILLIILFVDRVLIEQAGVHGDVGLEAEPLLDTPLEGAPPGWEGPPPPP